MEELLKAALELDLLIEMSIPGENKGFGENASKFRIKLLPM